MEDVVEDDVESGDASDEEAELAKGPDPGVCKQIHASSSSSSVHTWLGEEVPPEQDWMTRMSIGLTAVLKCR